VSRSCARISKERLLKLYQCSEIDEGSIVQQTPTLQTKERDSLNKQVRLHSQGASLGEFENLDDKVLK
jgi:hypothetical protein